MALCRRGASAPWSISPSVEISRRPRNTLSTKGACVVVTIGTGVPPRAGTFASLASDPTNPTQSPLGEKNGLFAGLSMVSNFKFYSGKDINLRKSVPFSVVVGIAMGLVFLIVFSSTLPEMLFLLFTAYGLSGYVIWVMDALKRRSSSKAPAPPLS